MRLSLNIQSWSFLAAQFELILDALGALHFIVEALLSMAMGRSST